MPLPVSPEEGMGHKSDTYKIITHLILQVNSYNQLGYNLSHNSVNDFDNKFSKYQHFVGSTGKTLLEKDRRETILTFYKT